MRFVNGGREAVQQQRPDPSLIKAILQARRWWKLWVEHGSRSLKEIAREEGVNDRYVSQILPLAFLAPDLVAMILDGRQPSSLTAGRLIKHVALPSGWDEQRRVLLTDPAAG